MCPAELLSIPVELLHYLCWYLSELDITSLSQTCVQLRWALNNNTVWKRFVSQKARNLESKDQLLYPPYHPDPNLCENRQHILRRNQMISNWRQGRCRQYSAQPAEPMDIKQVHFYKENFMFVRNDHGIQYCDVNKPLEFHFIPELMHRQRYYVQFFLIEDNLVVVKDCLVIVHGIRIEENDFPFLYSFHTKDDRTTEDRSLNCRRGCGSVPHWMYRYRAEKKFLFNIDDKIRGRHFLHVWDIVSSVKVGSFEFPVISYFSNFVTFSNNNLIMRAEEPRISMTLLKFNIETKTFCIFRIPETSPSTSNYRQISLFHNDHCIKLQWEDSDQKFRFDCSVFNFNTSAKITEGCFPNMLDRNLPHEHFKTARAIVDGKFVLPRPDSFLVVDALSLETVAEIPQASSVPYNSVSLMSACGSTFLLVLLEDDTVKVWDVESGKCTLTSTVNPFLDSSKPTQLFGTGYVCRTDKATDTMFVVFRKNEIVVTHFW